MLIQGVVFGDRVSLCSPGWLALNSAILLPQLPEWLGLQAGATFVFVLFLLGLRMGPGATFMLHTHSTTHSHPQLVIFWVVIFNIEAQRH